MSIYNIDYENLRNIKHACPHQVSVRFMVVNLEFLWDS